MNDLNPNKSKGYDRMDPKILKVGATELTPSLAVILTKRLEMENGYRYLRRKINKGI